MAVQHIINVDLARVYESENKKGFVRTLEWGDGVEVKNITEEHIEIVMVKHQKQDDGMIKPVPASGFIVPSKSSGIKPEDVVVEKENTASSGSISSTYNKETPPLLRRPRVGLS